MSVEFVKLVGSSAHFLSISVRTEAAIIEVGIVKSSSHGAVVIGYSTSILVSIGSVPATEWCPSSCQILFSIPVYPQKILGHLGNRGKFGSNNWIPRIVVGDNSSASVGVENGSKHISNKLLVLHLIGAPVAGFVDLYPDEDILKFLVQTSDDSSDLGSTSGKVIFAVGNTWHKNCIVPFQAGAIESLDDVLNTNFINGSIWGIDTAEHHFEATGGETSPLGICYTGGGIDGHSS